MQVSFYATLRPIVGGKTVEVPLPPARAGEAPRTVGELMQAMVEHWPALREHVYDEAENLSRQISIYVDGRNVRWLDGERTVLGVGDRIAVFPPVAGG